TDELLGQVANVLQQQSGTLLAAVEKVESLAVIAQNNAAATEQLSAFAEELLQTAAEVSEEISRFRVEKDLGSRREASETDGEGQRRPSAPRRTVRRSPTGPPPA